MATDPKLLKSIFLAAVEKATPEERAAFLCEACGGDEKLRRRADVVLRAHDEPGGLPGVPDGATPTGSDRTLASPLDGSAADAADLAFLAPSARPGALGRLGHYEVLEVLGRGGFGTVVRAFDELLERVVAIKVMAPQLAAISPPRKRFLREARAAAAVRHENVIDIYAVEEQPIPYLVMEYFVGETLQQKLDRVGPLDVPEMLHIGRQVAVGLAAAHALGLIHRDIKPSNILLGQGAEPWVKITDFGLARAADDASLTQSGYLAGTPLYMAPEQAQGEAIDQRADLFSLGSVFYVMLSGRPPFRAATTVAVLRRVAEDTPRPIREIIPEVPEWLCALVARLHAKKPQERFASAREVADLLARRQAELRHSGSVPAPAVQPRPQESPRWAPTFHRLLPRHRLWPAAAAVLLTVFVGLGLSEATGVTNLCGTVIRLFAPEGTLVVEVDDPGVSVTVDGADVVITGAGAKETRLKPGQYKVEASKDGKLVCRELVTVQHNGRRVVRISKEAKPLTEAERWAKAVARLSAEQQVKAVVRRLKELNPAFDGTVRPTIENGVVTGLTVPTDEVDDISPVRALRGLEALDCAGHAGKGKLADLTPLRGLHLKGLTCKSTRVADLGPLRGMPLRVLNAGETGVADLSPLHGMGLKVLALQVTDVKDLSPLKGMPLTWLDVFGARGVSDLSPLKSMPLEYLNLSGLPVSDLSLLTSMKSLRRLVLDSTSVSDLAPLRGLGLKELCIRNIPARDLSPLKELPLKSLRLDYRADREKFVRSFKQLERVNDKAAADFWKEVDGK